MSQIIRISSKINWEKKCFEQIKSFIIDSGTMISIALSGGKTPITVYTMLANYLRSVSFKHSLKIQFFLVDERNVSIESSSSNSKVIREIFGEDIFFAFDPTKMLCQEYYELIQSKLGKLPIFDLVILGCGEDGHTASLFPETKLLSDESFGFKPNYLETGEIRYSMTYPLILKSKQQLILVDNNPIKHSHFRDLHLSNCYLPVHKILKSKKSTTIIHEPV
ncbi:MAG: 6-phosphogluconolactonase [Schleiferiaceae bacterium]